MKLLYSASATILLLFSSILFAQDRRQLSLKTGELVFAPALKQTAVDSFNSKAIRYHNKASFVLQFNSIPSTASRKLLSDNGIELLDYMGSNAYIATVTGNLKLQLLKNAGSKSFVNLSPQHKIEPALAKGVMPSHAVKIPGTVDVWISLAQTFSLTEAEQFFSERNIDIVDRTWAAFGQITIRLSQSRIEELASFPLIQYIQPVSPDPVVLNHTSRELSRANVLNASVSDGGRGLNGEGMVIGVGDDAEITKNIDFRGRVINRNFFNSGFHGIHVNGTVGGAGNVYPVYRGYAPKSTLISEVTSNVLSNTPKYFRDYRMVVTNNSYGSPASCEYNGFYETSARTVDLLALSYPEILHVFAAGNNGEINCPRFPIGFSSIGAGFQSSKNLLIVSATDDSGLLAHFSSKGPVKDGRLKPEITAMGQRVVSSSIANGYVYNGGTSMAAPAVTGGAALLYQRYRQLNGNNNPESGLIKAVLCNGADDRGNPGPDYKYGFGLMNLVRSIGMLEKQHYFIANVANNTSTTHTISVPANTAQLKVMLYWHDPIGSLARFQALVNDLDAEVLTPAGITVLPKILDTVAANVDKLATNGVDHINNIEQVVIDNPAAGNYSIRVKGTAIAQGPSQKYFLVYDAVPVSLNLTYPVGNETLVPGQSVYIAWDVYGNAGNTFNVEYSIDNGNTWNAIATNLQADRRMCVWNVPLVATINALVRVSCSGFTSSVSHPFSIIGEPAVDLDAYQCEGSITIHWDPVPNASDYEVMMLIGNEMQPVGITSNRNWFFHALSPDSVYWISVRARIDGKPGPRSYALSRQPNTGNCDGPWSNNDLKMDSILSPVTGRKFTSTELNNSQTIKVRIRNLDDAPASSFDLMYSLNGGPWITETINTSVAANAVYEHSFASTIDLSPIGTYILKVVVKNNSPDPDAGNDTLTTRIRQLDNQPITINLATSFMDDLETAVPTIYHADTRGLEGIDRYDFENATTTGKLYTLMDDGVAFSGRRSLFMGESVASNPPPKGLNIITGTFNLAGKSALADDIRLDFRHIVNQAFLNNDVSIRGNDTQPWIKVYDMVRNLNAITDTVYKLAKINIADSLVKYGQEFSSSFQVRWRESHWNPKFPGGRMYSVDDIRFYEVKDDIQMVSIDTPVVIACGLSSSMPLKVSVYNHSGSALTNVPVKYSVNDGNWITETIPLIAANSRMQYTFTQALNLSAQGSYQIKAIVDYTTDTYRLNDTTTRTVQSLALISTYPHLQNFELDNGGWYTEGVNNSWEYGTPASAKINGAASGAKAWKTKLAGNYNQGERSFLYSPCYQLNGMTRPALSFSMAVDVETCAMPNYICDYGLLEYSVDGLLWRGLGTVGDGVNWYTKFNTWEISDYTRWHVATISLPVTTGTIRFRFSMNDDGFFNREGIAIDDIHIYDSIKVIYEGVTMVSPVSKQVSGNDWIDFESNGQLIASIHPRGQNLGLTNAQAFINSGAVRYAGSQYYHDRNITIKPTTAPTDSVAVRFYFLDKESNDLIDASGCQLCTKPVSAYTLGVSRYSNPVASVENGSIADNNIQGQWSFIPSARVKKVPFGKGYYAEFNVKGFSELWLNSGGLDNNSAVAMQVFEFTAEKAAGNDVLLQWKTGNEAGVTKYEIEVARGNDAFQANEYDKIGEVMSQPGTTIRLYDHTDREADKFGSRYYRIKIINANGSFSYSDFRLVSFDEPSDWTIYPNPSSGLFYLLYKLPAAQKMNARIVDTKGRIIKRYDLVATGFLQRLNIDLSAAASGIYLLQVDGGDVKQAFKLYKY